MLKQIQAATGLLFGVFLAVHLANTWLAAVGSAAYDTVQGWLRTAYQFPPLEALLLAALAVHLVVGLARIFSEPKRVLSVRARLHRYAGLFLALFVGGHILAVRGSSWFFDVYPGFEGLAFSVSAVPGYFYPYYFLLALAGFYHGLNGFGIAAHRLGIRAPLSAPALRYASASAAGLTLFALLGLGGMLFDVGNVHDSAFARLTTELTGVEFAP